MVDSGPAPPHTGGMIDHSSGESHRPIGQRWRSWPSASSLILSLAIVGLTVLLAHVVRGILPAASLMLFFLVAVLISAVRFGFWAGIAAAVFAFLAYNFFFVEPLFTMRVAHVEDVLALCVLLFTAGMTGLLAGRLREEANAAQARAAMLEQLSTFAVDLCSAVDLDATERVMVRHLAVAAGGAAVLLKPEDKRLVPKYAVPAELELDGVDHRAAERAHRRGVLEQGTAPGWSGSHFTFQPLDKAGSVIGYRPGRSRARVRRRRTSPGGDRATRSRCDGTCALCE